MEMNIIITFCISISRGSISMRASVVATFDTDQNVCIAGSLHYTENDEIDENLCTYGRFQGHCWKYSCKQRGHVRNSFSTLEEVVV